MMREIGYFDLHGDIGYDVLLHKRRGESDVFANRHLKKFQRGNIQIMCMACFFDGHETWEEMQEMVLALKADLAACKEVETVCELPDVLQEGKIYAIISVEGMCGIKEDVEAKITWLYEQGVRLASLAWNDENALASGVGGSEERGLSELGRCAIAKMEELGMILDVSHLNERSFWDVVACARKPFIASHSNAYALCAHRRNLKDEQLKAIAKAGGIIGINSANQFIDEKRSKQDCAHLVKHMKYIADLIGIEHVALGLDCMDFFEDDNEMPLDFLSCEDTGRLLEEMKKVFTLTEIKQIAGENAKALFRTKKG